VTGSVFGNVHSFFHSSTWTVIEVAAAAFVVVFYAATVYWVWKDARRRIAYRPKVWLATVFGAVVPFLGPLVYMLFRPPEYLEDVRERELEIRAIERRLGGGELQCHVCGVTVESDFLICPVCTARLRQACGKCKKPLEPAWQVCPYCETPVGEEKPVPLRGSKSAQTTTPRPRQPRRQSGTSG
jgi:RNA polymerase subunit RPABC4/transcription elongation factor Spt4